MVALVCNPSAWEAEAGGFWFKVIRGYIKKKKGRHYYSYVFGGEFLADINMKEEEQERGRVGGG
jgi:hypothetical protein